MPSFPTFDDLTASSEYKPPSQEKARLYPQARQAIASLRDALLDTEGSFGSDAQAIGIFRQEIGAMLPVAHPDATACSRACDNVRMNATRHRGGALVESFYTSDYRERVIQALMDLDIALARAITSQP